MSINSPKSLTAIPLEILQTIGDLVITFDSRGQINACSPSAMELLGLSVPDGAELNIVDVLFNGKSPAELSFLKEAEHTLRLDFIDHQQDSVAVDVVVTPMLRDGTEWFVALLKKVNVDLSVVDSSFADLLTLTLDEVDNAIMILSEVGELCYVNSKARQWVFADNESKYGWEPSNLATTLEDEFGEPIFDVFDFVLEKLASEQTQFSGMITDRFGIERRVSARLIVEPPPHAGPKKFAMVMKDITEAFEFSHLLTYQATHDPLTGCYNRKALESEIRALLWAGREEPACAGSAAATLCLIRFDQLDIIINECGYAAEEEALCQIKALIQPLVEETDLLARLRGGEFGLIFHDGGVEAAQKVIERLIEEIQNYRFRYHEVDYGLCVNVGIVPIVAGKDDLEAVMMRASSARQLARELGRNQIYVHDAEADADEQISDRGWLVKIQSALDADRLRVFCQKIAPIDDQGETHYEILVRMVSEEGELIPPEDFIRAAERYGWISDIEYWVIQETCMLLQLLAAKNPDEQWHLFINLSGSSIGDTKLEAFIAEQLMRLKHTGSRLSFEITETAAITDFEKAAQFMWNLKAAGCRFSLDDFGSGLSSFSYLQRLPVDYIKIDGEFIRDIADNKMHQVIVESIVHIGRKANIKTVAEYVQSQKIHDLLSAVGVDYVQGSSIGMPRPLNELFSGNGN